MASIVVAGDTSGTVTLTAPLVAGTTTLTLPTTNGTILTNASTGISASNITTGTLPKAQLPSGTVLQALQATNSSLYTITGSGNFTGLEITITPTSSSSRFLLLASIGNIGQSGSGGGPAGFVCSFSRNGTSLNYTSGGSSLNGMNGFVNNDANALGSVGPTLSFIDSPSTSSAITYRVIYSTDGTKWVGRRGIDNFFGASQQFQVLEIA